MYWRCHLRFIISKYFQSVLKLLSQNHRTNTRPFLANLNAFVHVKFEYGTENIIWIQTSSLVLVQWLLKQCFVIWECLSNFVQHYSTAVPKLGCFFHPLHVGVMYRQQVTIVKLFQKVLKFKSSSDLYGSPWCHPVYKGVTHMVLKFQKDPYLAPFQGQLLENYPLFCVKQGQFCFQKYPFLSRLNLVQEET